MTSTTEHEPAACAATSRAACTCGGGCEPTSSGGTLPGFLGEAASVGCTISEADAPAQLTRIETLRPHVVATERRNGFLALTLGPGADDETIDRFIETERGCCNFLAIDRRRAGQETVITFSSDEPRRELAIAAIARTFDPGAPAPKPGDERATGAKPTRTMLGLLGVACLACLLPGLLAAGAIGSVAAAFGGVAEIALILATVVATGAVLVLRRRRSSACGC